jgi:hypothetical protein
MSKMLTIKGFLVTMLLALSFNTGFSQTIWTETFSDQASATTNWVHGGTNASATPLTWVWTNVLNAGLYQPGNFAAPSASTGYMWFDSDANAAGVHDVTLTGSGAPANCTGKTNVHLKFFTLYRIFAAGASTATVEISVDGGTNWTSHVPTEFPTTAESRYEGLVDIAVPEADNQASVMVRFHWIANFEYYWKVDDLELYEYTAPVSSTTFKVNAALLTVDPAGMKIAGTFNNFADADMTNEGNGVWSYTLSGATVGTAIQYKFKNGPAGWEAGQAACGVSDGFGGFNRTYTPTGTEPVVLPAVCFNQCVACVVPCNLDPNSIICDNLDSYVTTLKVGPQATWWTTWSGPSGEGTPEDGIVTTEQAASAPNSMKVISTTAGAGPQDVMLDLGNKSTGNYSLKWKFYVPANKQAYYNIQNVVPLAGGAWNMDVLFDGGEGTVSVTQVDKFTFTFPHDAWFTIEHKADLDNNILKYYINNVFVGSIPYPNNLGGIDFFGTTNTSVMYVDDVEYVSLAPIVYNVDICESAVDLTPLFGGAPSVPSTSGLFDNTNATASATDPTLTTTCWFETTVTHSQWYSFPGDGKRYHIETVPCNATNYINAGPDNLGDTQMAIYTGTDCSALTPSACIDDLFADGNPDWRAGLDIETVAGENYYMLIDGYRYNTAGPSLGEYCIEVTQQGSVSCDQGVIGAAEASNPFLCFGENLSSIITLDEAATVIPTVGPVFGMSWAISSAPIPAGTYPPNDPSYIGGFRVLPTFVPGLPNDGTVAFLPAGAGYFFTPVVLGGGTLPAGEQNFLQNVDVTGGCFFTGTSIPVFFVPDADELEPLSGSIDAVAGPAGTLLDLSVAGGLGEFVGDESFYTYLWSNGATTQDVTVTGGGNFSVTISDASGCIEPVIIQLSGVKDPSSVKGLSISPNPTNSNFNLSLVLENALDVRAELVNSVGQVLRSFDFGKVSRLNENINVADVADGVYFLRLSIDGQKTQRSVVVSH